MAAQTPRRTLLGRCPVRALVVSPGRRVAVSHAGCQRRRKLMRSARRASAPARTCPARPALLEVVADAVLLGGQLGLESLRCFSATVEIAAVKRPRFVWESLLSPRRGWGCSHQALREACRPTVSGSCTSEFVRRLVRVCVVHCAERQRGSVSFRSLLVLKTANRSLAFLGRQLTGRIAS
jgi:hypothetical protein